jgi:hypothetical protein
MQFKLSLKAIFRNCAIIIIMALAITVYDNVIASETGRDRIFTWEFMEQYLFSDRSKYFDQYGNHLGRDIPRGMKLILTWEAIEGKLSTALFGLGTSMFKGGGVMEQSIISEEYSYLIHGTRPFIVFLLLGSGVLGTFVVLCLLFYPLLATNHKNSCKESEGETWKELRYFIIALICLILVYNSAFRSGVMVIMIATLSMMSFDKKMEKDTGGGR